LTAHGTDPDKVDEATFNDVCIMYADGMIGNRAIVEVLGCLTAGQFNKVLPQGKPSYKLQDIIGRAYDYLYPPMDENEKQALATQQLLAFAMLSPGAPKHMFEGKHG